MKLDVTEIITHIGMRLPYAIDEPPIVDEDLECGDRILGKIIFTNAGGTLIIEGAVKTEVVVPCSRCLEYYKEPVSISIEEQFELEAKAVGPRGRYQQTVIEEDENPDSGKLFEGMLFDLSELLRQGITLGLPSQPLHDESCKGLCPHCGNNLNIKDCGCTNESGHPALAGLKALLGD
ncbi:MAG: DUF177 domain-containing protein [Chthonomonadales bacterium]